MIGNTLIVTIAILLAVAFWLMSQLRFLIPYRRVLLLQDGPVLALAAAVLFVNVFAVVYALQRKFFLKDTGRKLSHIDKQAIVRHSDFPTPKDPGEETLP